MASVGIFYRSSWDPAVIHYTKGRNDEWEDSILQKCTSQGEPQWQSTVIHGVGSKLEFVMCNFTKSQWDNPPPAYGTKNYTIKVDKPDETPLIYTLAGGQLTAVRGPKVMLVTDLDGTLLGDDEALKRFNDHWMRNHKFRGSSLIYSTGRNLKDFLKGAKANNLIRPDYAICGVGTEIYTFPPETQPPTSEHSHIPSIDVKRYLAAPGYKEENFDPSVQDADLLEGGGGPAWCPTRYHARLYTVWRHKMEGEFDRLEAEQLIRTLLPDAFINGSVWHDPYRVSVSANINDLVTLKPTIEESLEFLSEALGKYHILMSGPGEWKYLDVLPPSGGKRVSIEFLAGLLGAKPNQIMTCGDSGNDMDMFTIPGVNGCCVGNAQEDFLKALRGSDGEDENVHSQTSRFLLARSAQSPTQNICFSKYRCAAAILDALAYFGFDDRQLIDTILLEISMER